MYFRPTMKRHYTLLVLANLIAVCGLAQTTIAPLSVTSTLNSFGSTPHVDNLIANISPATTTSTTFPFSPSSNFSQGIGYVSALGQWQGSITYTFVNSTSVSRMLLWNAYFTFELNHSLRDAQLVFYNAMDQVISTTNVSFPQAVSSVLTPQVVDLPTEVLGVKKVVVTVQSLWGGNEISLRRMAFAGTGQQVSVEELDQQAVAVRAYPNPSTDHSTLDLQDVLAVEVLDAAGRMVHVDARIERERVVLHWAGAERGLYTVLLQTRNGRRSARVVVE